MQLVLTMSNELNLKLKQYKIKENFNSLNETVISILEDFFITGERGEEEYV